MKGENIMSLINELRIKSNNADNKKQEVISEIKEYFDNYLNSDQLEKFLRANIKEDDIKARKKLIIIEFWNYASGCSTTSFYCAGLYWYNPENKEGWESHYYKTIELRSIQDDVCDYLEKKLRLKMEDLGFTLLSKEDKKGKLEYFNKHFYFGW